MGGPARRCLHPNWSPAVEPKHPNQPVDPCTPTPWLITDARQVLLNAALERCLAPGAGAGRAVAAQLGALQVVALPFAASLARFRHRAAATGRDAGASWHSAITLRTIRACPGVLSPFQFYTSMTRKFTVVKKENIVRFDLGQCVSLYSIQLFQPVYFWILAIHSAIRRSDRRERTYVRRLWLSSR